MKILTSFFSLLFVSLIALSQVEEGQSLFKIETRDGNKFVGTIVLEDSLKIIIKTELLSELTINRSSILRIKEIDFKNYSYWIDAGAGYYYSTNESDGLSYNFSANLINNRTLYKIRFLYQEEFNMFGPTPSEKFYCSGIMLGKGFMWEKVRLQLSGGLGITGGIKRGKYLYSSSSWFHIGDRRYYEEERFFSPSIPLEIDFIIKPLNYLGLGVVFFVELNSKRPMFGFVLKLSIGKLS